MLKAWRLIDSIVAAALRETSCIRETVLQTCARGYAELDPTGTVIYANAALLEFCPDLIGKRLAEVFVETDQVEEAIEVTGASPSGASTAFEIAPLMLASRFSRSRRR